MIKIDVCPICNGREFKPFLTCKDHTVSQETFQLHECVTCSFKITTPRPSELGPYYLSDAYISHSKKAKSILDRVYITARQFTLKWKVNLINSFKTTQKNPNLLDYGCGTGTFLESSKKSGWNIHGIEPSEIARTQAKATNGPNIHASLSELQLTTFDIITLWHVLEHVENLNETIESLKRLLSDSGTMFIAVPNHNSWDARRYSSTWAAFDVPRHLWHFSQLNMRQLMEKNNLRIIRTKPMKLDAYYVSLLSEKYTHYKKGFLSRILTAIVNGIKSNGEAKKTSEYSSLIYIIQK